MLSDKTGTLTQNIMGFVWASFGGRLYGAEATERRGPQAGAFTLESGTPGGTLMGELPGGWAGDGGGAVV